MFQNGKSGVYKISTKALQNLWRKNKTEIEDIINELIDADVCIIEKYENEYVFKNRRMMRQSDISEKRSKAVQTRYNNSTK
jgi:hypothetical protein